VAAGPLVWARTLLRLGPVNVTRVAGYRLGLAAGVHPVQHLPAAAPPRGPFFDQPGVARDLQPPDAWRGEARLFGWHRTPLGSGPPDWYLDPLSGARAPRPDRPWWRIPDFDPLLGDIKTIWELSRFDWVVNLAQQAAAGDARALARLNEWLADWCARNPPYRGHNWKCGQESSIRVLHLAVAALVLEQTGAPRPALADVVSAHLRRIAPTVGYATAQDNNHGTSEAAALFVGGSWLEALGHRDGARWRRTGHARLEERARRLIQPDGSFSQYSVNYHRLMLDTLCLAELWRRHLGLPPFSARFTGRAAAATDWLRALVDPVSGDAPNFGANDGANLLPLTGADHHDHRPSVQLAAALFQDARAYPGAGAWETHLAWLGVAPGRVAAPPVRSRLFDDGGQAALRQGDALAVLLYPRFRFRPSHADAMHVDLWVAGENLLRDGGSFGYHADAEAMAYFPGVRAHNTAQFEGRETMPRLSRFLWGSWPRTTGGPALREDAEGARVSAAYRDAAGASHERALELTRAALVVRDRLAGFSGGAVIRWRLRPGAWRLDGAVATDGRHRLTVSGDGAPVRLALVRGWESRYYLQKTEIPVLEIAVEAPGTVTSEYRWG